MLPRLRLQTRYAGVLGAGRRICSNGASRPILDARWCARARRSISTRPASDKVRSKTAIPVKASSSTAAVASILALGGLVILSLSSGGGQHIRLDAQGSDQPEEAKPAWVRNGAKNTSETGSKVSKDGGGILPEPIENVGVWFRDVATVDWGTFSDRVADFLLPEWSKSLPGYARKLQRELDSEPGSLAQEIWHEARDPTIHPEIQYAARVRVSDDLCNEEKAFRASRKTATAAALAKYLQLPEGEEVHPDDVPVIALCGSGGGLRALVAGTGSLMAVEDAGLFDCVTYTAGVSGSCWLQALYFASFTKQNFHSVAEHLRSRLGIHIAHPPEAFSLLTSAPTNKYLLSGSVERFKADPNATFGLVDIYGTLLAARLLVPRGELGVSPLDFKISNQRRHLTRGENPMPIYTAVRHEIPALDMENNKKKNDLRDSTSVKASPEEKLRRQEDAKKATVSEKEEAKNEAWFQWFEITPYEFFCEEFAAGIPTWAMGRKFKSGQDVPPPPSSALDEDNGYRLPEVRMPLMLGIFGSAFCATLSHYYKEIRPIIKSFSGMAGLDEMIWGRNDDLSKVHPIEPAVLPNPVYGMKASQLPNTVPPGLLDREHIQLMDAGMSNNLPLYPFMRPGRGVEVVLVFDASADIRQDNWLCVADGYARKRGVKGWPIGVGWPQPDESPEEAVQDLKEASAGTKYTGPDADSADAKLAQAKKNQDAHKVDAGRPEHDAATNGNERGGSPEAENAKKTAKELGYCTVWVGSTEEEVSSAKKAAESSSSSSSSSKIDHNPAPPIDESTRWRLSSPDAGLTLIYLPYLANEAKVPGVNPATSEYMSTWNFIYTPEQVDKAIALAKANFAEGADQIRATVRAVYERKKQLRLKAALEDKKSRYRRLVQLGKNDKLDGDHFNP